MTALAGFLRWEKYSVCLEQKVEEREAWTSQRREITGEPLGTEEHRTTFKV